jgi:hypothetical protein
MRTINEICVHCTATRPNWLPRKDDHARVAELRRWHVEENGWSDIGYHYIVTRSGTVITGRPVETAGAHEPKINKASIGVVLFGGFGSTPSDDPSQHYTPEQLNALRDLITQLRIEHGIKKVTGHNQYAAKACPGFNVPRWLAEKAPARPVVASKTLIGQTVAASGTGATAVLEVVNEAQTALSPLTEYATTLRWVFIGLVFAGIAITVYARLSDWGKGRK